MLKLIARAIARGVSIRPTDIERCSTKVGVFVLSALILPAAASATPVGPPVDALPDGVPRSVIDAVQQAQKAGALAAKVGTIDAVNGIATTKSRFSKLHAGLDQVVQQTHLLPRSLAAGDLAADFPLMRFRRLKPDSASVALNLTARRDAASLAAVLTSLGATNISTYGRMVGARVPVSALEALNGSPELLHARPAMARTHRGSFLTQGDFTMRTRFVKPASAGVTPGLTGGPTGSGIKLGVLSDSFACNPAPQVSNGITTFANNATQDLANNEFAPVTVLKDISQATGASCADGEDEGRAMIQLIADVAPDSTQAFYTAFESEADFANGILALRNNYGADIVVDDVGYFDEPYFQDGIVAQAAQSVYDSGGMYFSSAGNSARLSYEAPFQATTATISSINPNPGTYHNFNTAASPNTGNNFRLARGAELTLAFEWDQPYASATVGGAGSQSDLDIFLINASNQVVAYSADNNIGGDPFEILDYTNPGAAGNFRVVIEVFSGPAPTRIKWVSIGGQSPTTNGTSIGFNTNSPTATGHPAAAGVMSTGAAPYYNTTECGTAQTTMESFSSWGGTPILFDKNGNRLATPVTRQKPDITAPDGGRTSFFLSQFDATPAQRPIVDCQDPNDGLANNFFGTSAAAPHAAGVAALLKQAAPQATNAQIYAAMRNSAADITAATNNPGATPGFDFQSGYGFVRADAAYAAIVDTTPDAFAFTAQTGVARSVTATSNTITVSGITAPSPISITGGSYRINSGAFVTTAGTVTNGDQVTVQQVSSSAKSTTTNAVLTIGGVSGTFAVTTVANVAPVANAGTNQTFRSSPNLTITLDGSGSSDSDGSVASYAWTRTDGGTQSVTLSSATAAKPTFKAPKGAYTLQFQLVVTDDNGATSPASSVSVTLTP